MFVLSFTATTNSSSAILKTYLPVASDAESGREDGADSSSPAVSFTMPFAEPIEASCMSVPGAHSVSNGASESRVIGNTVVEPSDLRPMGQNAAASALSGRLADDPPSRKLPGQCYRPQNRCCQRDSVDQSIHVHPLEKLACLLRPVCPVKPSPLGVSRCGPGHLLASVHVTLAALVWRQSRGRHLMWHWSVALGLSPGSIPGES